MSTRTDRMGASRSPRPATGQDAQRTPTPRGNLRWLVVGMCFLGVSINYLDRANLSIAMPEIVKDFHISHTLEGLILGAFFWTYALFQLPAGHFIDKLGARVTYAVAVVWWSVFTALSAVATGASSMEFTVSDTVAGAESTVPSLARYLNVSGPK